MSEYHYRIKECLGIEGVIVRAERFSVIKETKCGKWVVSEYSPRFLNADELIRRKFAKWVSNTSNKKLCYPTIQEAVDNYRRRKERQQRLLQIKLEEVDLILAKFDAVSSHPDLCMGAAIGKTPSHDLFMFD